MWRPLALDRVEVISDRGRRRRYDPDEKRRLVEGAFAPGVSVGAFARERGVDPSLLYRWRRALEAQAAPAVAFAPVVVTSGSPSADPSRTDGDDRIEIVLRNGRRVLVSEAVDSGALARILATAERA